MPKKSKHSKGFTLIELLIVIVILGILSGILLMVFNPARHLARSRNSRRALDIHTISMAVYQYMVDTGSVPGSITEVQTEICNETAASCTGYADLSDLLVDQRYLISVPEDPSNDDPNGTGYEIYTFSSGRISVIATLSELGEVISETR